MRERSGDFSEIAEQMSHLDRMTQFKMLVEVVDEMLAEGMSPEDVGSAAMALCAELEGPGWALSLQ